MDPRFLIGLAGAVILIAGAAMPDRPVSAPWRSGKNWLFALGNAFMFTYAILGWLAGGPMFFVILQIYIACSTVFMMAGTPDWFDTPALAVIGAGLVAWSLLLAEGVGTAVFVCGLVLLGIGFAMEPGRIKREVALALGSAAIAVFSFLMADWIFTVLNAFFALLALVQVRSLSAAGHRAPVHAASDR